MPTKMPTHWWCTTVFYGVPMWGIDRRKKTETRILRGFRLVSKVYVAEPWCATGGQGGIRSITYDKASMATISDMPTKMPTD